MPSPARSSFPMRRSSLTLLPSRCADWRGRLLDADDRADVVARRQRTRGASCSPRRRRESRGGIERGLRLGRIEVRDPRLRRRARACRRRRRSRGRSAAAGRWRSTSARSRSGRRTSIFLPLTSVPSESSEPAYGVPIVTRVRVSRQPSRHSMKWRATSPPIEWPMRTSFASLLPGLRTPRVEPALASSWPAGARRRGCRAASRRGTRRDSRPCFTSKRLLDVADELRVPVDLPEPRDEVDVADHGGRGDPVARRRRRPGRPRASGP